MANHESQEGFLDYGSGRYKLVGRASRDDYYLHAGEWVEVWNGMQWVVVQVLADVWGVLVLPGYGRVACVSAVGDACQIGKLMSSLLARSA